MDTSPAVPRGRSRRWRGLAAWLVVVATGAGLFAVGTSQPTATAEVVGRVLPVSAGAVDKRDISANNSPSIARSPVDPENLVISNRVDLPRFSCALHSSFDGGAAWAPTEIPFPEGEEAPPRCFAPDVAFGADGTLYVSFATLIGLGNTPNAIWVVTSTDGGRTLSVPARALGPLAFQVRLSADPVEAEVLYLSWLQATTAANLAFPDTGNPVNFARSDDGGATWGTPVRVSAPSRARVVAPSTAVGRDGRLFVLYLDLGDDVLDYHGAHEGQGGEPYAGKWSLVLARSTDGGRSWRETVVDAGVVPIERFVVFLAPFPSVAADPRSGRVYVAFHDASLGDADVWAWTSDDAGVRFGPRVRVNDTIRGDGTAQYLPRLAVAANGRLDVVYYDRRSDRANLKNSVSLQSSSDGGRSFGPRVRVTDRSFDSRIGFGSFRNLADLGSRLALLSTNERALAVWSDTRAGTEASGKQDLARAVVAFEPASSLRTPLRAGGATLAGLGLVGGLWSVRRRSVPPPVESP